MQTLASKDTNGMIEQLFIFKKSTTKKEQLKITTPQKYLVFFSIERQRDAVIQCSKKPLLRSTVERTFLLR
jgi:hypothetical protein